MERRCALRARDPSEEEIVDATGKCVKITGVNNLMREVVGDGSRLDLARRQQQVVGILVVERSCILFRQRARVEAQFDASHIAPQAVSEVIERRAATYCRDHEDVRISGCAAPLDPVPGEEGSGDRYDFVQSHGRPWRTVKRFQCLLERRDVRTNRRDGDGGCRRFPQRANEGNHDLKQPRRVQFHVARLMG